MMHHQPSIAYPEMTKSSLVLFDMAAFYLPLHGQSWKDFFTHAPILSLVEGLIYQVELALESADTMEAIPPDYWQRTETLITTFLAEHQLDNPVVLRYLTEVGEYFQTVQQLLSTDQPSYEAVIRAAELRPADIRLLHAILLQRLGQTHDATLFDILWPLECLLDLKANLTEYTDDLATGHYNTYQMFVTLYGEQAPKHIQVEQQRYEANLQDKLTGASIDQQQQIQQFMQQHETDYPSVAIPQPIIRHD
ncbi:MAG: hypothetical protein AAFO09_01175 [Pseudomonadota bacterium]